MKVIYITPGGIPGKHNIYYEGWSCEINSSKDVSGYELTDFETVNAAYHAEHPDEPEEEEI
jgi:ABC-type proline/glycine betaine transport system substrate-binding protein